MPTIHYEKRDDHIVVMTMEGDNELWSAIVTGAGTRAFSAGGDMKRRSAMIAGATQPPTDEPWNTARPNIVTGLELWKPIIAAVNGYCLGGAFALALACD